MRYWLSICNKKRPSVCLLLAKHYSNAKPVLQRVVKQFWSLALGSVIIKMDCVETVRSVCSAIKLSDYRDLWLKTFECHANAIDVRIYIEPLQSKLKTKGVGSGRVKNLWL